VDLVLSWVKASRRPWMPLLRPDRRKVGAVRRLLESAVQSACYMVFGMGQLDPGRRHVEHPVFLAGGFSRLIAQVGDSRVYLFARRQDDAAHGRSHLINFRLKLGLIRPRSSHVTGKNVITGPWPSDYVEVEPSIWMCSRAIASCSAPMGCTLPGGRRGPWFLQGDRSRVTQLIDMANDRGGATTSRLLSATSIGSRFVVGRRRFED